MMKVGRRGFLGLMAGGVAAGPKLASSLAQEAAANLSSGAPSAPYYGGQVIGSAAGEGDWRLSRISELRKLVSGGTSPQEEHWRRQRMLQQLDQRDRFRIDALRSVSMVNKHRIFNEGEEERTQRRQRMEWESELDNLTTQLSGGLL